jgi:hypothetical protein
MYFSTGSEKEQGTSFEVHAWICLDGSFGVSKTSRRLASRFWWPQYRVNVSKIVSKCSICRLIRANTPPKQGNMVVYPPNRRFELVAVDIMDMSPKSRRGNITVIVAGDSCTRFTWTYQVKDKMLRQYQKFCLMG